MSGAAVALLAELSQRGAKIEAHGGQVTLRAIDPLPPEFLEQLRAAKPEILALLSAPAPRPVDPVEFEERAAIIEYDGAYPRDWSEGLARLSTIRRPESYTAPAWETLLNDAAVFLDRNGADAARLGWTVLDCFGVDPDCPATGYAAAGLVALLKGEWTVAAMHADRAELVSRTSGARQSFYRAVTANGAQPIWNLR